MGRCREPVDIQKFTPSSTRFSYARCIYCNWKHDLIVLVPRSYSTETGGQTKDVSKRELSREELQAIHDEAPEPRYLKHRPRPGRVQSTLPSHLIPDD
jgi:hypothetical protein